MIYLLTLKTLFRYDISCINNTGCLLIMIVVIYKVENKGNPGINIVLHLTGLFYTAAILAVIIIFYPKRNPV